MFSILKHQLVIDMSKPFENFFPIDYTVKVAHIVIVANISIKDSLSVNTDFQ